MARLKGRRYRIGANALNFANYAIFAAATVLVLISARAKCARVLDNSNSLAAISKHGIDGAGVVVPLEEGDEQMQLMQQHYEATNHSVSSLQQQQQQLHQQHQHASYQQHHAQQPQQQQQHHHNHQHQHQHAAQHEPHNANQQEQQQQQQQHHHHTTAHNSHNNQHHRPKATSLHEQRTSDAEVATPPPLAGHAPQRAYHSKYSVDELLQTRFERKISNDIDIDPCKAGGFMGDIALPDIEYGDGGSAHALLLAQSQVSDAKPRTSSKAEERDSGPVVASMDVDEEADWQGDAPALVDAKAHSLQFNATFQQELERLKQEVYHEGLQVEEEGLTEIIRKKTKLPASGGSDGSGNSAEAAMLERQRNDAAIVSTNEPVKSASYAMHQHDYLLKSFKNEVIAPTQQQLQKQKQETTPQQPLRWKVAAETEYFEPKASMRLTEQQQATNDIVGGKRDGTLRYADDDDDGGGGGVGGGRGGGGEDSKSKPLAASISTRQHAKGDATMEAAAIAESVAEAQKLNKTAAATVRLGNRNVDQRRIQSNTKDIEVDSGNNFVAERRLVIVSPAPPPQRSTLPNVYSNAGGNGMKLDDVEFLHADGVVRRRHRRGRKNRRSSEQLPPIEYASKLQRLRDELNRPVRTIQPYAQHVPSAAPAHHNKGDAAMRLVSTMPRFNYSSEESDEMDVLTKRKATMDAITNEMHQQTTLEMDLLNAENLKHLKHHHRMARAVTAKKERIWDYGVIPYEIDGNFSGMHKALFKQAMRHWENSTCIKFVERDPEIHPNYIVFTVRSCGCCSFVGKRGNGPQAISIGRNCDKFGIVVHELGHVVGFWHEHTRPDREKHVVIEKANIMKGQDYNFNKLTPDEVDSLGLPYDYDSIMHYARNTFSKGSYLDTILPIEMKGRKRPEIGQRLRLSAGDIAQANLLYKCPKCGRTFQENTAIFASPMYYTAGAVSNETENCEWRITATHGERVVLRLENLNILKSVDCQTDYLEIRDGYYQKSPLIGRFCGKVGGDIITSETSRMLLTYVNTHRAEGYRGFKAEYEVICGGELVVDDAEGRLESPNYPLDYLPSKECVWKITVPKGFQVALKFQSFEVENHDSCVYDFVEVRDGATQDSPLIGVFCGFKAPPNMKSSGHTMFVKFVSDSSVQKAGFSAIFMKEVDECETKNHGCQHDCINTLGGYECSCHIGYELHSDKKHCEDACGGVIEYPNGTITSPSFPDKYPVLKECIWEIIALPQHKISLNFTHFDLEGRTHQQSDCGYDSVTIYSKLAENRLKRIGTYCGGAIPPTATSEGNGLRVEFRSDKSIQHSGFAAVFFTDIDECSINNGGCQHECRNTIGSYMCSCHNGYSLHENGHDCKEGECKFEISAPYGSIYSPNYPDPYPPNADCVWHFLTTPGHRIRLIFNEFNVESHQECAYDNVAIYDGESETSSILGRFCGDKIPYPISSSTNQLYMVLKTDKNKQLNGFTAMHSTSCGGYLRATNQIQQFYSHARFGNHDYNENMDCEWTIQAPAGSNVQLIFLTFDIESSENCTYDYVQVFSGMEDTSGPMYGQYCGSTLPQDIISLTDSLLVRLKTDISITMKGFSASYVAVDPFENSDEFSNSYSAEMVTPFPGSLKSIYKEDTQETDDYSDFSENHLVVNNPLYHTRYYSRY